MSKSTFFSGQPVLSQLLNLIPKSIIVSLSNQYKSDYYYKRFKVYDHLVTMLYSCFHRCTSIREVITGMQASYNKLCHLGLSSAPRRSTLSEANAKRNVDFFEQLYHQLYRYYYAGLPDSRSKKSLESRLFIMDSTTVPLFSDIMKGAGCPAANGRKKGGVKAHVVINAQQDIPQLICLSNSARNDRILMPYVQLRAGSILVFDRGYHHFARWQKWTEQKITWVTRIIDRETYQVIKNREISDDQIAKGVCADQLIILGKGTNRATVRIRVRLITYQDPQSQKHLQFLTNNMKFSPSTVADMYKKRWQIESFFKRIKQHNQLRFFLGDNENAIKIQIWCAFITDLLVKIVKDHLIKKWSFANISAMIRHHLMNYIHLSNFLNAPEKTLITNTEKNQSQYSLFPT
jgi:hypothetical protein